MVEGVIFSALLESSDLFLAMFSSLHLLHICFYFFAFKSYSLILSKFGTGFHYVFSIYSLQTDAKVQHDSVSKKCSGNLDHRMLVNY